MALDIKATRQFDDEDALKAYAKQRTRHEDPENQKAISRIARAAKALGMSYGRYVALHGDGDMPDYVPRRRRKTR